MDYGTMKLMSYLLAFVLLMYSIVSFLYSNPSSGKIEASRESSIKGVLMLGMTLILAYVVSVN